MGVQEGTPTVVEEETSTIAGNKGLTKEVDHEQRRHLGFVVKLIPYYKRDLIIIERVEAYKYTNTRAKM